MVGVTRERFSKSGDWAKAASKLESEPPFASGCWTEGLEEVAVGAAGVGRRRKRKLARGRLLSKSPWVSVAAGLQAHVCGCCFVLYNKLLGVHEVAGSRAQRQRGAWRGAVAGRAHPSGRERQRAARRTASFHLSRRDSHVTLRSPARPKEDTNNSYF